MPFRKAIPISDLGRNLSPGEIARQETTYQAGRGGWFKAPLMSATCATCQGAGGKSETTTGSNGAKITTWRPCSSCSGRGSR